MPADKGAMHMYDTYFHYAEEAEKAGRFQEAANQYRLAAKCLYENAATSRGSARESLIRRGDLLVGIADAMEKKEKQKTAAKTQSAVSGASGGKASRTPPVSNGSSDESNTVWQAERKPNITFDDIAGLDNVKQAIRERIILPRKHPEIFSQFRLKAEGGVLLYGPPGTGKTMIAKAIANEIDASFYSVRCSDIVGKYFGEAERNVKSLFETARGEDSAIIFFDEFEALAAKRGGNSTVMNRLVPELLSQMDGFTADDSQGKLLILAATNRPWDIDSAFLRPPRLTQKILVTLPDYPARLFLIEKAFRNVPVDGFDAGVCAERTDGSNAADIVALCNQIKMAAVQRTISVNGATSPVTAEDLELALSRYRPSVQKSDIIQLKRWEESQGV